MAEKMKEKWLKMAKKMKKIMAETWPKNGGKMAKK